MRFFSKSSQGLWSLVKEALEEPPDLYDITKE